MSIPITWLLMKPADHDPLFFKRRKLLNLESDMHAVCLRSKMCYSFGKRIYLRNEFNFWNVHGIINTSGLLQSGFTLTLQKIQKLNLLLIFAKDPKIEFIAYTRKEPTQARKYFMIVNLPLFCI